MKEEIIIDTEITLSEIEEILDESYDTLLWVEPNNIVAIDYAEIRNNIKKDPDYYNSDDIDIDYGFDMSDYLLRRYCNNCNNDPLCDLSKKIPKLLMSASFIAKNLYTYAPSFSFYLVVKLINKENIHELLTIAKAEYNSANDCEKIYLSALYLNFFDVIFCADLIESSDKICIPLEYFNNEDKLFLAEIQNFGLKSFQKNTKELQKNCSEE